MTDIEKAKKLLESGKYTCVLCRGDIVYTSDRTGISPMMGFIKTGVELVDFSVADKIVGKAAALLFVLAGIREVYAEVLSDGAAAVLKTHGLTFKFNTRVEHIINRKGDGICPMEMTVAGISEPQEAFSALEKKIEELRNH